MSTITLIIILNVVLCIAILAGQIWHYGRILRTPKQDRPPAAGDLPAAERPTSS